MDFELYFKKQQKIEIKINKWLLLLNFFEDRRIILSVDKINLKKENTYFYHISLGSFIISCMSLTKEKLKTD